MTFKQHLEGWRINIVGREVEEGHCKLREHKAQRINPGPSNNIMWLKHGIGRNGREEKKENREKTRR